jgi:Cu-Zn family superoxide dismutase
MKTNLMYLAAASLLFACNSAPETTAEVVEEKVIVEEVAPEPISLDMVLTAKGKGNVVATINFTEVSGKTVLTGQFENLPQGKHGIHLHETGDCSSDDASSAGGHWNPTNEAHGKWGVPPFHRGDIGNFEADKDGKALYEFGTDLWCIGCGDPLRDIVGKSVIIHAGEDDCTSQPSGNAGARIACGVIPKK